MPDIYQSRDTSVLTGPLIDGFPITPSDTVDLPNDTRQIRVGVGGNIAVRFIGSPETTRIIPVNAGDVLDWRLRRVMATGTTATGLWGYY